jgi:hypothetical protein
VKRSRTLAIRVAVLGLALVAASCSSGPIEPFGPTGTTWTVESIDAKPSGPAAITVAVVEPSQDDADADLAIATGCRSVSLAASWDKSDGIWVAIDWPPTLVAACDQSLANQDHDFFDALSTVQGASINGDVLTLHGDHEIRLRQKG